MIINGLTDVYSFFSFHLLHVPSVGGAKYRLRQDSQLLQSRAINWSQDFQTPNLNGSRASISSSTGNINNDCSESNSSTETLKWLGSMSDVSVASQATNTSTLSGIVRSQSINLSLINDRPTEHKSSFGDLRLFLRARAQRDFFLPCATTMTQRANCITFLATNQFDIEAKSRKHDESVFEST